MKRLGREGWESSLFLQDSCGLFPSWTLTLCLFYSTSSLYQLGLFCKLRPDLLLPCVSCLVSRTPSFHHINFTAKFPACLPVTEKRKHCGSNNSRVSRSFLVQSTLQKTGHIGSFTVTALIMRSIWLNEN